MSDFKRCSRCGVVKRSFEFNRNGSRKDGLQSRCRPCQIEENRKHRLEHPEWNRERCRRFREAHAEEERERKRVWDKTNPEKRHARKAVERALKVGVLIRPSICGRCSSSEFGIHAHHEDYSRPLEVLWLCAPCHGQRHIELSTPTAIEQRVTA